MSDSRASRLGKAGLLPLLAAVLMLHACASKVYMGIPLTGGGDPTLRSLAQRASAGDKQAQLDLGIRYEEGRGVPVDVPKAKKLYRLAAADSGARSWVYSPPTGNGTAGRVIPIKGGPVRSGLVEARSRLARLEPGQ